MALNSIPDTSAGEISMGNYVTWGSLASVYKSHFHFLFLFTQVPLQAFPPGHVSLQVQAGFFPLVFWFRNLGTGLKPGNVD